MIYSPWNISNILKQDLGSGTSPNSTWTSDAFWQRHGENCLALLQNTLLRHLFRYFRCSSRSFWCLRNRWPTHAAFFHACCVTFTAGLQTTFPEPIISTYSSLNQVNKQEEQVGNLELWEPCAASTLTSAPLSPAWNGLSKQIPPFFLMKQNSIPACLADVSFNGAVVEALRKQFIRARQKRDNSRNEMRKSA